MLEENADKILELITPRHLVLDVGGWACPFNRANYVIDQEPYSSRGFYRTMGGKPCQGGEKEYFNKDTWIQRDICDKKPWPFEDKYFDFCVCSHTLEDIRDPLYVCSEIIRVSKQGYIEVPSRIFESSLGIENNKMAGFSHHRWLIEIEDNHLQFTPKYGMLHSDAELSFPRVFFRPFVESRKLPKVSFLFWTDRFTFDETVIIGLDNIRGHLKGFVNKYYHPPFYLRARYYSRRVCGNLKYHVYLFIVKPFKTIYHK